MNYNHKEAFCHMQYFGRSNRGQITLMIWNSRDGVTPFVTISEEYGIELQHVEWQKDKLDPDYKPKKGDLIWRDWTEEDVVAWAKKIYAYRLKDLERHNKKTDEERAALKEKFGFDIGNMLQDYISEGEEGLAKMYRIEYLERKQPFLELVKEDWL